MIAFTATLTVSRKCVSVKKFNERNIMIDIFISIVIGIISSFVSAFIWLYFFGTLRPKIDISPEIAKDINASDGSPAYIIKIINHSRRPAMNIRAKLSLIKPFIVPQGQVKLSKPIPLKSDEIFSLKQFSNNDRDADYAFRFVTFENLEDLWSNDETHFLVFRVFALDSLSGLGKLFEKKYTMRRNTIKKGSFVFGNSFEIK
jgi:hypothetical protein